MSLFDIKEQFATKQVDKWQYIDKMYEVHSMLFDYASFIKGTNISKIEIEDGNVIMTFRDSGVKFICAAGDKRLAPFDALNFGGYEEEELSMQMALIGKYDVVFDIGANYGWYAAHMAKRFPEAKIFSFEPIPKTYESLQKNLSLNNIHNVTAVNIGMGEQKDRFVFYYDPQLSVNASMSNLTNAASVESTVCEVSTLDHFSIERGLKVDFIKCDIEGAELLAFKGGRALLERDKPIIFSEMLRKWTAKFNYHPNDIIDFLKELGYTCFVISEGKLMPFSRVDENTSETNYFFLHAEKHIGLIEKYSSKL
ncbi:MAG: FkbM family methyltransferase [Filimonas sp.]|nr:FkbM family methyltransferase [Filimonas sp.]